MKTNRLSKKMAAALNAQMTREAHAAQIYLAYAAWCQHHSLSGIARFLFRHAGEERNHMMKLLEYILNRGAEVEVAAIPMPHETPAGIQQCFEKIWKHETENTSSIYALVKQSFEEEDWATWNFLQWFVKEQVEEEAMAQQLLDKLKISGGADRKQDALYLLDHDLEKATGDNRPAEEATAVNP